MFQGAKITLASHFDYEYVLGHKIAFLCVARGTPRPHITWYKDGNEIFTHQYLHVSIHELPVADLELMLLRGVMLLFFFLKNNQISYFLEEGSNDPCQLLLD